jgi:hypothetical protein
LPSVHSQALARAVELCGEAGLAARLGVTLEQLKRWISQAETPPGDVFLKLVDIIWDQAVEESKRRA